MRILVSDYSGHPFQVQLSRELARRGHVVTHTYSAGFQTPKGNLFVGPSDPAGFAIEPVRNSKPFAKHTFFARRGQEIEIGRELAKLIAAFEPDIVISSNAPLDTQRLIQAETRKRRAKFIFWLQDIYSNAISRVVPEKFPIVGLGIAALYRQLEFSMLRKSDHVVAITQDFVPIIVEKGVKSKQVSVVENWAPLDELPRYPRENDWTEAHMPGEALRIIYSGTLGYKHNPSLLISLARAMPDSQVHVFSEGEVAAKVAGQGLANLFVHSWVPFADLPKMLSGADILVAVIEPEAGVYSVPSKVLTYLGIGRPILASVPGENLAAKLIGGNEAGYIALPGDDELLIARAKELAANPRMRQLLGDNGRAYAARAFNINAIADRFEAIIANLD